MYISQIKLKDYKNLDIEIHLSKNINLIIAPNGAGKTNFIEAVMYFANGNSFRGIPDQQIFPDNKSVFFSLIEADLYQIKYQNTHKYRIVWTNQSHHDNSKNNKNNSKLHSNKKFFKKNYFKDKKKTNLIKFKNSFKCLLYAPDFIDLVSGPSANRRKFIDDALSFLSQDMQKIIENYKKVLKNKNKLLKNTNLSQKNKNDQIKFWNEKLIKLSAIITSERISLMNMLMPINKEIAKSLYHKSDYNLSYEIDSKYIQDKKNYFQKKDLKLQIEKNLSDKIYANLEKELVVGFSLYGAHRDDYNFFLNFNNVRHFASRGEQRLLSLILYLSLLRVLEAEYDDQFIILLDDVLSELDKKHKNNTLEFLFKLDNQIILSTSEKNDISKKFFQKANKIKI